MNWRWQFWIFALFSVSWTRCPIIQYFKLHWVAYFNMYSFDEHMVTLLYAFSDQRYWNVQDVGPRISHSVRIYVTEDRRVEGWGWGEAHTAYQGKFCVNFVNYLRFILLIFLCRTFTNLCFLFRFRSYPVPHRGERVKQRKMHARNWTNYKTSCKILRLNTFSSLLKLLVHFLGGFKIASIYLFFLPTNFSPSSVCRSFCVELTVRWFTDTI